jgi:histone deacetylase 6
MISYPFSLLHPLDMTEQQFVDSEEYYEQLSLYVNEGTTTAAMLSCGGVIEAALAVARGEMQKSFAIVRPPGHHAEPDEHMGFCFFNNVAVAARVVQQRTSIKRILILDWYVPVPVLCADSVVTDF